jgi:dolichol-phosphate mannosyltransferase
MTKYSIVLPTYNEAENILVLLNAIIGVMKEFMFEVVIVDDNSPDDTYNIVQRAIASKPNFYKNIVLLKRSGKYGLGTAYKYAVQHVNGDFVILMDADNSHSPKYIPEMINIQKLYNADIVNASRYSNGGGVIGWGLYRRMISKTANYITRILLNSSRTDMTGSFRLYRKNILDNILSKVYSTGYSFQMETIIMAEKNGYNIVDLPYYFVDREHGVSKLGSGEIFGFVKTLIHLFIKRFV